MPVYPLLAKLWRQVLDLRSISSPPNVERLRGSEIILVWAQVVRPGPVAMLVKVEGGDHVQLPSSRLATELLKGGEDGEGLTRQP